jgi:hypothetical protein
LCKTRKTARLLQPYETMKTTSKMPKTRAALLVQIRKGLTALGATMVRRRDVPLTLLRKQWTLVHVQGTPATDARALPGYAPEVVKVRKSTPPPAPKTEPNVTISVHTPTGVKVRVPLPFHLATQHVTAAMIGAARRAGLSDTTAQWLLERPRSLGDVLSEHPGAIPYVLRRGVSPTDAASLFEGLLKVTRTPLGKQWLGQHGKNLDVAGAFLGAQALTRKNEDRRVVYERVRSAIALWTV